MSSLDVLNAIGEAHAALIRLPELEAKIKSLEEDCEFIRLDRDEAESTISRLMDRIAELDTALNNATDRHYQDSAKITELESRNADLDRSLADMKRVAEDLRVDLSASDITTGLLAAENESLESRLAESRSFADKLSSTLKSIGRSIVTVVEVPEVTSAAPFPVSNPVGLPTSSDPSLPNLSGLMVDPVLAETTAPSVVKEDTSAGCYPYRYW
jgi:chromosome segregation ATPase